VRFIGKADAIIIVEFFKIIIKTGRWH